MTKTTFGNYVLGLAGLSLIRRWYHAEAVDHRRPLVELAGQLDDHDLLTFSFATPEMAARDGYTAWSDSYDGDNPMIAAEEAIVTPRMAQIYEPGAVALDAGCGTGRHAATLAEIGYQVIGTDLTPAMLDVARAKVPGADFREGTFEDLPVDDGSVDLVTSALAVCHATDLAVVFAEFARVLKPGGRVIVSDPHPTFGLLGGQAFFQGEGFDLPFVRNHAHPLSDYVTAMISAGFTINSMVELPYDQTALVSNPTYRFFPDVVAGGLEGLPFVVIFEASLS